MQRREIERAEIRDQVEQGDEHSRDKAVAGASRIDWVDDEARDLSLAGPTPKPAARRAERDDHQAEMIVPEMCGASLRIRRSSQEFKLILADFQNIGATDQRGDLIARPGQIPIPERNTQIWIAGYRQS